MKNKSYSKQFCGFVKNNDEGWNFIKQARSLLRGSKTYLKVRGRNPNRKSFATSAYEANKFRQDFPMNLSTHYGLYVYGKNEHGARLMVEGLRNEVGTGW